LGEVKPFLRPNSETNKKPGVTAGFRVSGLGLELLLEE
jgi:hypothetical protein